MRIAGAKWRQARGGKTPETDAFAASQTRFSGGRTSFRGVRGLAALAEMIRTTSPKTLCACVAPEDRRVTEQAQPGFRIGSQRQATT